MFVDNFSPFAPSCDSVIVDDGYPSTVGNDTSECSMAGNNTLCKIGDVSVTKSSNVPMLDSGSSSDESVTWYDFVLRMDNDELIEYERMSSEGGPADGSVGIYESKILLVLANGNVWQPSGQPWHCDFYLYHRPFPAN